MRERSVVGQGRGDDETEKLGAQHTDRRAFLRGLAAAALAVPLASLTVSRASTAHAAPANLVWTDRVHYDSGSGSSSSDSSSSSDEYDQNGSDDDDDVQNNREDEDERGRRRTAEDELEALKAEELELKEEVDRLGDILRENEDEDGVVRGSGNVAIVDEHRDLAIRLLEVRRAIALLERDL